MSRLSPDTLLSIELKARRFVQSASGYSVHDLRHVAATTRSQQALT